MKQNVIKIHYLYLKLTFNSDWQLLVPDKEAALLQNINPLNAELNPISHLLPLLGAHPILHVSRIRVKRISNLSYR
jgi:hypothetical protein